MPGCGSWNGRWTGEESVHAIVKNLGTPQRAAKKGADLVGRYSYDFGDGWRASVEVRVVDAAEARSLRKRSRGFAGYDWMVSELLDTGTIAPLESRQPR
jgi:hypothetical protein